MRVLVHTTETHIGDVLDQSNIPMPWHIPQPIDTGRLQGDRGVDPARHGVINDAQLLLGEQTDEVALGLDEARDVGILRPEVGDDLVLLRTRRLQQRDVEKLVRVQAKA